MLLKILKEAVSGQRVLLLGFGREGRAVCKRLMQVGGYAALGIADAKEISDAPAGISLHTGADYQDAMREYDIVFKSPGIVLTEGHKPQSRKILPIPGSQAGTMKMLCHRTACRYSKPERFQNASRCVSWTG